MINQTGPNGPGTFLRSGDGTWNLLPLAAVAVLVFGGAYYFFGDRFSILNPAPSSVSQDVPKNTPTR